MIPPRYFNQIKDCGTFVEKSSLNSLKIQEEIEFYQKLPKEIENFFPKFMGITSSKDIHGYMLEKINLQTVSEISLTDYSGDRLYKLYDYCFEFLNKRPIEHISSKESCDFLYKTKVNNRFNEFLQSDIHNQFLKNEIGRMYILEYTNLINKYFKLITKLEYLNYVTYSHGDFCFSNMFLDSSKGLILIDPRGYDKKFQNMHDPLYDIAKLSHSALGGYDLIINDEFKIIHNEDDFPFELEINYEIGTRYHKKTNFIKHINERNINAEQLFLREASLFLSMIPLHPEKPQRVKAFVLQAKHILKLIDNETWVR